MGNPTDPDAGTNRTNAVSRDNLMNGTSLGYSGYFYDTSLNNIGSVGVWWSSTSSDNVSAYYLDITKVNHVGPQNNNSTKVLGRSVRCLLLHW